MRWLFPTGELQGQPASLESDSDWWWMQRGRGDRPPWCVPESPRHMRGYYFTPMIPNLASHQNHFRKFWKICMSKEYEFSWAFMLEQNHL